MAGVMIVSKGESRGWDGGKEEEEEEEESGRTPWLLQQAINPHYKQASQHYHVIPFITTWAESAPLYIPLYSCSPPPNPQPRNIDGGDGVTPVKNVAFGEKKNEEEKKIYFTCSDIDMLLTSRPVQILMRRGSITLRNANELWMPKS